MAGRPTVQVLLDDGTDTFPHNVTDYVLQPYGHSFNRGREDEQTGPRTGTLNLTFNNTGGEFSPGSTGLATPSPIVVDQKIRLGMVLVPNGTFDVDTTGWSGGNAALAVVASPVKTGDGALRLTAIAGADMSALTPSGTSGIPVLPGVTYRLEGWFRTAVTARSCFVRVRFYDSGGALVSTVVSSDVTDSTSAWTRAVTYATAPATAAFAQVAPVVKVPAAAEVHYVDDFFFGLDRYTGHVKGWPVSWPGGSEAFSVVRITASDAQARAERHPLRSVIQEEILADSPSPYYTLGEPEGATSAADSSGNQAPALTMAGSGTDVTFGTATSPGTDGLTAATFGGGKYLRSGAAVSAGVMECFFSRSGNPSVAEALIVLLVSSGTSVGIVIDTDGTVTTRGTDLGSSPVVTDGEVHHLSWQSGHVLVDGVDIGSPTDSPVDGILQVGGHSGGFSLSGGTAVTALTGSVSHVAGFGSLTTTRAAQHSEAGSTGFAGESGTDRITRLGGYAGLPLGTLDTSLTDAPAKAVVGTSAWSAIQDVVDAEGGLAVVDGSGDLVFTNRNDAPEKTTPDITVTAAYITPGVEPTDDDAEIINYFETTAEGTSVTQVVRDTTSDAAHGRYPESKTYLVATDQEALDRANWMVGVNAEPITRYGTLTLNLLKMTAEEQAEVVAKAEPGAWLRVTGMNSQTPGGTTVDVMVQGFTEKLTENEWELPCNVVARAKFEAAIYDDATFGVYGESRYYY